MWCVVYVVGCVLLCRMLQSSVVLCRMLQSSVVSHATEQRLLQSKRVALFLWRGVVVVCCLRWYHLSCVCVYAHIVFQVLVGVRS